jgi:hypothetical protein
VNSVDVKESGLPAGTVWHASINGRSVYNATTGPAGIAPPDIAATTGSSTVILVTGSAPGTTVDFGLNQTYTGCAYYGCNYTLTGYHVASVTQTGGASFTSVVGTMSAYGSVKIAPTPANITLTVTFVKNPDHLIVSEAGLKRPFVWGFNVTCTTPASCGPALEQSDNNSSVPTISTYAFPGTYSLQVNDIFGFTVVPTIAGAPISTVSVTGTTHVVVHYYRANTVFVERYLKAGATWGFNLTCISSTCMEAGFEPTNFNGTVTSRPTTNVTVRMFLPDGTYTVQWWNVANHTEYGTTEINVTTTHGQAVKVSYDQARVVVHGVGGRTGLSRTAVWTINITGPNTYTSGEEHIVIYDNGTRTGPGAVTMSTEYLEDGTYSVTYTGGATGPSSITVTGIHPVVIAVT